MSNVNGGSLSDTLACIAIAISLGSLAVACMSYRSARRAHSLTRLEHDFKHTPRFRISDQDVHLYPPTSPNAAMTYSSTIENQGMVVLDITDLDIEYYRYRGDTVRHFSIVQVAFSLGPGERKDVSFVLSRSELNLIQQDPDSNEVSFFFTVRFSLLNGWRGFTTPLAVFRRSGANRFADNEAHFLGGWQGKDAE